MENRAYAAIAIAFLIIFTAGSAYLFYWLQAGEPGALPYRLVARQGVDGLEPQADVTYMGLLVGHVSSIRLDPTDPDQVLVDILVQPEVPMVRSMHAELVTRGVTGIAQVRLVKPSGSGAGTPLQTSVQTPATLPLEPGRLQTLMDDAADIAEQMKRLGRQLNALTATDNRREIMDAIAAVREAAGGVRQIEAQLEPTLDKLPAIAEDARAALQRSQALLQRARDAASSIDQAGQEGARLAQSARQHLLPEIDAALTQLQATAQRLQRLAENLQRQPQSLLLGPSPPPPGPGEPGFEAPRATAAEGP